MRIMQSNYKIDTFQETYFVIDNFTQLFDATASDFTPYFADLRTRRDIAASEISAKDKLVKH